MSPDWSLQLNCVVLGRDLPSKTQVTAHLRHLDLISQIDEIPSIAQLRDHLSRHPYNFAVVVLDHAEDNLPACLLRYPELKVLVITPSKKAGPLQPWLTQGASDIVSLHRPEKMKHAIDRIVEESRVKAELCAVQKKLDSQNRLQQILLDSRKDAVMLWQHSAIVESNRLFDELINCHSSDSHSRSIEWKRWVSAPSFAELNTTKAPPVSPVNISNHLGQHFETKIEPITLDTGKAKLIRINPRPVDQHAWEAISVDSATGILLKKPFVSAVDSWLQSTDRSRYTIVQIQVDDPELLKTQDKGNSTVKELLSYRIATLLKQEFGSHSLIGRTAIGGLVEDRQSIRIKTLSLSTSHLCAKEVLDRLEQPPVLTQRITPAKTESLRLRA